MNCKCNNPNEFKIEGRCIECHKKIFWNKIYAFLSRKISTLVKEMEDTFDLYEANKAKKDGGKPIPWEIAKKELENES